MGRTRLTQLQSMVTGLSPFHRAEIVSSALAAMRSLTTPYDPRCLCLRGIRSSACRRFRDTPRHAPALTEMGERARLCTMWQLLARPSDAGAAVAGRANTPEFVLSICYPVAGHGWRNACLRRSPWRNTMPEGSPKTTCPTCGAELAAGARFCGNCGSPVPAGAICKSCGAALSEGAQFCPACGTATAGAPAPSEPEVAPPPPPPVLDSPAAVVPPPAPAPDSPAAAVPPPAPEFSAPAPPAGPAPYPPAAPPKKKSKTGLIIVIVVIVVLLLSCCCAAAFFGPGFLEGFVEGLEEGMAGAMIGLRMA